MLLSLAIGLSRSKLAPIIAGFEPTLASLSGVRRAKRIATQITPRRKAEMAAGRRDPPGDARNNRVYNKDAAERKRDGVTGTHRCPLRYELA